MRLIVPRISENRPISAWIPLTLHFERLQPVEFRRIENGADFVECHAEPAMQKNMQKDLLQAQQFFPPVVAVEVHSDMGGLQETDGVGVVQRPDGKTRQYRQFLDRVNLRRSPPRTVAKSLTPRQGQHRIRRAAACAYSCLIDANLFDRVDRTVQEICNYLDHWNVGQSCHQQWPQRRPGRNR